MHNKDKTIFNMNFSKAGTVYFKICYGWIIIFLFKFVKKQRATKIWLPFTFYIMIQ